MRFQYVVLHVPTGTVHRRELTEDDVIFLSRGIFALNRRMLFLELLNKWSAQQPTVWQYWTEN